MAPRSYPRYHGEGSAGCYGDSARRNHLSGVLRKAYRLGATAATPRPRASPGAVSVIRSRVFAQAPIADGCRPWG
jgi:hypothetical protein